MEASQAWQATLGQLQMELPKATYDTWVRDTKFIKHQDETFLLVCKILTPGTGWKTGSPPPHLVC